MKKKQLKALLNKVESIAIKSNDLHALLRVADIRLAALIHVDSKPKFGAK